MSVDELLLENYKLRENLKNLQKKHKSEVQELKQQIKKFKLQGENCVNQIKKQQEEVTKPLID